MLWYSIALLRFENAGTVYDNKEDDLYRAISAQYCNFNACADKIAKYLHTKYNYVLMTEEKTYLTIYIERGIYKTGE